ncbi:type VI secretion system-associated FHA domain protein TagH [Pseudomonas sp. B6002]|uniref:type VI secretion system-associated FHA domain protein TagH n=1 Tax=Pseudomonas sp. B6002 TaxID=2726978 RepID=UPI0015A425A6|nr:type VI secretion system-associated FHA domain protein TagH [Pseudomonas sp. B6002]NVZ50491.1 type VI secretion system-associated FHA domain protein TagH [Pseudomonas sp. B6002]
MQLVFELCVADAGQTPERKVFDSTGGVIGRGATCDWVIPDASRLLSSHHGLVSYRDGQYFLTDISSNGIRSTGNDTPLPKGQAHLIGEGEVFQLGALSIRARLVAKAAPHSKASSAFAGIIPDDAYLNSVDRLVLAPLHDAMSEELNGMNEAVEAHVPWTGHNAVERDHLVVPTRAAPRAEAPPLELCTANASINQDQAFWTQFAEALGVSLDTLDAPAREALAIKAANLLRQSVDGLQQSLRTHEELKSEFNLGQAGRWVKSQNPLRDSMGAHDALRALLGTGELGQLSAELAIAQVCRDIQVHQVAVLVACRTAMRNALAAFSPGHLQLCFEREGKPPRFAVDGAYWRAYRRHYQQRIEEDGSGERQLQADFARAYDDQVRLVSTLYAGHSG